MTLADQALHHDPISHFLELPRCSTLRPACLLQARTLSATFLTGVHTRQLAHQQTMPDHRLHQMPTNLWISMAALAQALRLLGTAVVDPAVLSGHCLQRHSSQTADQSRATRTERWI